MRVDFSEVPCSSQQMSISKVVVCYVRNLRKFLTAAWVWGTDDSDEPPRAMDLPGAMKKKARADVQIGGLCNGFHKVS